MQEYLTNYYAEKHQKSDKPRKSEKPPRSPGGKSAPCLGSSPTGGGPGHTILKKSLDHPSTGDGDAAEASASASLGHSPSLPNRHAKFRDVVEIVEFGERDQVKTGVHFAHEEQLHDDEDDDDDEDELQGEADSVGDYDDDDRGQTFATPSECSSTSDELVLFFSQGDDDSQLEKVSTPRSGSSTEGTNSPEALQDDAATSPLLDTANVSNENVLKNIFSSLSSRGETPTSDRSERRQPTVKHVRLMDRVEPVERENDYS